MGLRGRAWALVLLDGDKGGRIVGELAVWEKAAARHGRGWAALNGLPAAQLQRIQPALQIVILLLRMEPLCRFCNPLVCDPM